VDVRQASRSVVLEDVRKAEARRKLHLYLANRKHVLLVMQYLYFHVSEKYTTTVVICKWSTWFNQQSNGKIAAILIKTVPWSMEVNPTSQQRHSRWTWSQPHAANITELINWWLIHHREITMI
jgi:hypothetical protein